MKALGKLNIFADSKDEITTKEQLRDYLWNAGMSNDRLDRLMERIEFKQEVTSEASDK